MGTFLFWWGVLGLLFWLMIDSHRQYITCNLRREIPLAIACGPVTATLMAFALCVAIPFQRGMEKVRAWVEGD